MLFVCGHVFQVQAGRTVQLHDCTGDHNIELRLDSFRRLVGQVPNRLNTQLIKTFCGLPADPPDFIHRNDFHQLFPTDGVGKVEDTAGLFPFLGGKVSQLGQGLGRSHTDTDRNAGLPSNRLADALAIGNRILITRVHAG